LIDRFQEEEFAKVVFTRRSTEIHWKMSEYEDEHVSTYSESPRFTAPYFSLASDKASNLDVLPDCVLQYCFSFVGPGHYRYIAGTCHHFLDLYNNEAHSKKTTWKCASHSVSRAELCLKELRELGRDKYAILHTLAMEAAKDGNVNVLEWTRKHDFVPTTRMFQKAAANGHVSVFEWAEAKDFKPWNSDRIFLSAISNERIRLMEWLVERRNAPRRSVALAAELGKVNVLRWLKERDLIGRKMNHNIWYDTAYGGHVEVLEFLHTNGYNVPPAFVVRGGVDGNQMEVLAWTRDSSVGWDESFCAYAASAGNLHALQWLRENNCPWNGRVISEANSQGHMHIVEWSIANGCPRLVHM
jgi:hypothetical protein